MTFSVEFSEKADEDLQKLDISQRAPIMAWIKKNLVDCEDPRRSGHALTGPFAGFWRYRVGKYRLVAEIRDDVLTIVIVAVGNRKNIYD